MNSIKNSEQIDKIVKELFFCKNYLDENHFRHHYLCEIFKFTEFNEEWIEFWREINTRKYLIMDEYFELPELREIYTLLRLLIVEDFKVYMDNKQNNKKEK